MDAQLNIVVILGQFFQGLIKPGEALVSSEGIKVEIIDTHALILEGDEERCKITFPASLFHS